MTRAAQIHQADRVFETPDLTLPHLLVDKNGPTTILHL